ncbi:MAG: arginase, partial [Bdellovibrionota bacterium]
MVTKKDSPTPTPQIKRPIGLIGVPTDVGASDRGGAMGPEALRVAGLAQALKRLGYQVHDHGNLQGPVNPMQPPKEGYRHLDEVIVWCQKTRDAVYESLREGEVPVILGGDHCLAIGSIAGVARHCADTGKQLYIFWLDAHADFNTPDTSPSGNIHGMPAAVLSGHGHERLLAIGGKTPVLDASRIIQIGIRSVDAHEKIKVVEAGVNVLDMRQIDEIGMRAVLEKALGRLPRK